MRDEDVRSSCFQHLAILWAHSGPDVAYRGGLDQGFPFRGQRVPYLNYQKGIYRARVQRGPAALSIQTSYRSPYSDHATPDGYLYDYRAGPGGERDNAALRAAFELRVPIVHFVGTRPGWYRPEFPWYVTHDDPPARRVLVSPGAMVGPLDEQEPAPLDDELERRYAMRAVRVRMHQARFRGRVVPAYRSQCAICRLKQERLLDAAHILADSTESGEPAISNGLSLCSIHHRAFDGDLVGISPDYHVAVSQRLLDDADGPMLDLLKGFHGTTIELPVRRQLRPDPERLALRFDRFLVGDLRRTPGEALRGGPVLPVRGGVHSRGIRHKGGREWNAGLRPGSSRGVPVPSHIRCRSGSRARSWCDAERPSREASPASG